MVFFFIKIKCTFSYKRYELFILVQNQNINRTNFVEVLRSMKRKEALSENVCTDNTYNSINDVIFQNLRNQYAFLMSNDQQLRYQAVPVKEFDKDYFQKVIVKHCVTKSYYCCGIVYGWDNTSFNIGPFINLLPAIQLL